MNGRHQELAPWDAILRFVAADRVLQFGLVVYVAAFAALPLTRADFELPAEAVRNLIDPLLVGLTLLALLLGRARVPPRERRFWDLLAAAWACWLAVDLIYFLGIETPILSSSFIADGLYLLYYLALALAIDLRPHLDADRTLTALGRRLESMSGLAAIFGLLIYFAIVVLPEPLGLSLSFVSRAGGFTPMLLVRLSLDLLILARLVFAAFSAAGRWRRLYALLAFAMTGYSAREAISLLRYEEIFSLGSGLATQAILYLPGLFVFVLARARLVPAIEAEGPRRDPAERDLLDVARPSPIALYALVLPALHFLFYPLGLLDPASRGPREVFCLVYVFVLGGLAWIYQSVLAEDHRDSRKALRQAEERLASSRKLESVGRLAGGIAHDFNNYLTVIRGYSDLLKERLSGPNEHADLEHIEDAAKKATHLTRQLLAFGRRQVLRPEALDLNAVVRETSKMLHSLLGEDIVLEVGLDSTTGLARADLGQTEQLLVNLAINGRDAMPHGGTLSIRTRRLQVDAEKAAREELEPGSYVSLEVADTGIGMSEEVRNQAFEPFFTTKGHGRGTGLGLSTVYGIVTQSGGSISVDSVLGEGTSFRVLLPSAAPSEVTEPSPEPLPQRKFKSANLLLVEDEDAVRRLASLSLSQAGFTVHSAADGADAVGRFLEDSDALDLLITDVLMPGMDGVELASIFQARSPALRVLFLSGYPTTTLRERQKILPRSLRLLAKPFSPSELVEVVYEVLEESSPVPAIAELVSDEGG